MVNFGYPYNDLVICKDSTDYLPYCSIYIFCVIFPSKNGRAFPMFWQMTCPNHIFIGFYAEDLKSQQNFESITLASSHEKMFIKMMSLFKWHLKVL